MTYHVAILEPKALMASRFHPDETIVGAALYAAGIEFFIPFEWEIRYIPRNKKKLKIPKPLVPGYAFIDGVRDFEALRKVDGIRDVIKSAGCPVPIHDGEIWQLMADESAINAEFERKERLANRGTREALKQTYRPGSVHSISHDHLLRGEMITVTGTGARGRIEGIIARLGNYPVSIEAGHLEAV